MECQNSRSSDFSFTTVSTKKDSLLDTVWREGQRPPNDRSKPQGPELLSGIRDGSTSGPQERCLTYKQRGFKDTTLA